ncbi:hypothetical protein [Pedobacter metabolipauper]|uniref:Uncharacterized protein n=1 Tax=Pedobacter metabolipauper TaxID=425513 RepID=A0A4R6SP25_9SPHI|nr:hypothetical protein [Pedobacter metabolipauper]TDQ06331.1 hypothetical protein ATK78_4401 [Pedobacter metabolipauper]
MTILKRLFVFSTLCMSLLIISGGDADAQLKKTTDTVKAPPLTWKEHWFEHDLLVKLVYQDKHVAFYYDDNMSKTVKWPFKAMSDTWAYVKKTYGDFGPDPKLYVVFHQSNTLTGGHPSPYFDASHDFHNVLDCGLPDWTNSTGQQIGIPIHEIGHIVNNASHGTKGSPSDALWGDSKFMEIFNYDVLMNIGMKDEAARVFEQMQGQYDNFPRARTQWFKNWFYPIYSKYGKGKVLNKYFELLSANYPKNANNRFTKRMTWGDFVHFWSGAAGVNLKEQATLAFGWSDVYEAQFKKAQEDFPNVKYK